MKGTMDEIVRIWLDDERPMPSDFNLHAHSYQEAIGALIFKRAEHISFDHDLGGDKTGYDVAAWIELQAQRSALPRMTWAVHSANPVGAERIRRAMESAEKFWALGRPI
jgi:hypothetical protein